MTNQAEQHEQVSRGPGQILKQAREQANLSSQDIADKIKLKRALIEDIEQDNYDVNISLTFIKGYLKLYAKYAQADEAEVISAFEKLSTQEKEPAKLQSFSRRVANQANDDKLMMVTYMVIAVVIALVVIWWFQQTSSPNEAQTNAVNYPEVSEQVTIQQNDLKMDKVQPPPKEPSLQSTLDEGNSGIITGEAPIEEQPRPASNVPSPDNQAEAESFAVDQPDTALLSEVTETQGEQTAAPVELIFEFSGDCWMNLADATGENIAFGVKVKGRVMPITGIPPFVVTLGAPEVVKIRYGGEPLDMSFLPTGRIAKFELPLSE